MLLFHLTLNLALLKVLSENAKIGQHHRLITGYIALIWQWNNLTGIQAEAFLAGNLIIKKVHVMIEVPYLLL